MTLAEKVYLHSLARKEASDVVSEDVALMHELASKYASEYVIKNAGAWDDFINWLRQLFGGSRKNTTGENMGNLLAFGTTAGTTGYGLHKGYDYAKKLSDKVGLYSQSQNEFVKNFAKTLKGKGKSFNGQSLLNHAAPLYQKGHAWASTPFMQNFAKYTNKFRALPGWGKAAAFAVPTLATAGIGTKIYDSVFND